MVTKYVWRVRYGTNYDRVVLLSASDEMGDALGLALRYRKLQQKDDPDFPPPNEISGEGVVFDLTQEGE